MADTIPFIHNYCDRWCERCSFTRHCALSIELEDLTDEEKDLNNEAFWKRLSNSFKNTYLLIEKEAKEHGIDVGSFTEEELEVVHQDMKKNARVIEKHRLTSKCREYSMLAHKLLEDEVFWRSVADGFIRDFELGVLNEIEVKEKAESVKECQEVIGWYMFQIEIKFARALSGKLEDDDHNDLQSDANGSAKVALIGVERSMHAFAELFQMLKEEDRFLPILSLLKKIDKMGREEFPNGPFFIRPGFDEQ